MTPDRSLISFNWFNYESSTSMEPTVPIRMISFTKHHFSFSFSFVDFSWKLDSCKHRADRQDQVHHHRSAHRCQDLRACEGCQRRRCQWAQVLLPAHSGEGNHRWVARLAKFCLHFHNIIWFYVLTPFFPLKLRISLSLLWCIFYVPWELGTNKMAPFHQRGSHLRVCKSVWGPVS